LQGWAALPDDERAEKEAFVASRTILSARQSQRTASELGTSLNALCLLLHHLQAWTALPDDERAEKEAFHRGQGRTASGFMALARTTLDLLNTLSGDAIIVSVTLCYF
jgi:hypothetical protein